MMVRLSNPTPTQWALIGTTVVLGIGLVGGTAYAASERKKKKLPRPTEPTEPVTPVQPPADDPYAWQVVTPDDAGYPWEFPALQNDNYPTPSTWFNASDKTGAFHPSKGFDRYIEALLGSALAMAGNDPSIATAKGQDPNASLGKKLRRQVRESIVAVGGVNDLLYGQDNLNIAGGNDPNASGGDENKPYVGAWVLNAEGRGLNWLPRHADNLDLIQRAEPLKRTTSLVGRKLPSPNRGSRQMVIWAPAYDLVALGPDQVVPTIKFLQWSDGSSTADPPPRIQQLGVDLSGVDLPGI